jgi:hypothetical protein
LRKKSPLEALQAAEQRQARAERLRVAQLEDKVARLANRAREKAALAAARSKVRGLRVAALRGGGAAAGAAGCGGRG